jgi:hypothetical protein
LAFTLAFVDVFRRTEMFIIGQSLFVALAFVVAKEDSKELPLLVYVFQASAYHGNFSVAVTSRLEESAIH